MECGIEERRNCNQRICFASTKIHRSETLAIKVKSSRLLEIQHTHINTNTLHGMPNRCAFAVRRPILSLTQKSTTTTTIQKLRNIPKSVG